MTVDNDISECYTNESSGFVTLLSYKVGASFLQKVAESWCFWRESQTIFFPMVGYIKVMCFSGPAFSLTRDYGDFEELLDIPHDAAVTVAYEQYEHVLQRPLELHIAPWITLGVQFYDKERAYAELERVVSRTSFRDVKRRRTLYPWATYALPIYSLRIWQTTLYALSLYGINMKYRRYRLALHTPHNGHETQELADVAALECSTMETEE